MDLIIRYLDGTQDKGDAVSIRVDGQFITVTDSDGDQTIVNGNAIKKLVVSTDPVMVVEGEVT